MTELVDIHLLAVPLDLHQEASEHSAEVLREFEHMTDDPEGSHAPARLVAIHRTLQQRYRAFTEGSDSELEQAIARRDVTVDLTYRVPLDVGDAGVDLLAIWDEVDRYCEAGQYLLALKTPPRALAYRLWFVGEFIRQAAGDPAVPWPEWERAHTAF
jgi:hypothetical protein